MFIFPSSFSKLCGKGEFRSYCGEVIYCRLLEKKMRASINFFSLVVMEWQLGTVLLTLSGSSERYFPWLKGVVVYEVRPGTSLQRDRCSH